MTIAFAGRIKFSESSVRTRMLNQAATLSDVIPLGRGDPDLATPAHIVEAGRAALSAGATHYTHPKGLLELRQGVSRYLGTRGLAYGPDDIVVTSGAQEAVFVAMLSFINPGDEVILPSPGYGSYDQAVELAGGVVVSVKTYLADNFALTAEAVRAAVTPRTRMLCLINPSNPTGTVTSPDEIRRLCEVARQYNLLVISDEIYAELLDDDAQVLSVAAVPGMYERTITINGFSKSYAMTGWRVGYFAAPPALLAPMTEVHHGLSICAPAVSQYAALAAITGDQGCVAEMRQIYARRRKIMTDALGEMGLRYARPQGAFYVYAEVTSTGLQATEFCERLLQEARVMIFPGSLFGDHTDDFVRISLLQPEPRLKEAVDRIKTFARSLA
ncbi:pyridoxal phosphate-dependent aminotransferase [Deinococcus sp. UYEF24]